MFCDNVGDLYIDGLQLTKNDVQTKKYNTEGKIISRYAGQKSTSYTYDTLGRMKIQTSPSGLTTTYTYDARGNLTKIQDVTASFFSFENTVFEIT